MGKSRDSMMRKLDAFEKEMNDYGAEKHAQGEEPFSFSLEKKMRLDMIKMAREPGGSIDTVIDAIRPQIKAIIDRPAFYMETSGKETLQ